MATTFESCNETVHALLRQVMRDQNNALNANEVTIDAIWARRLDEDENGDETLVSAQQCGNFGCQKQGRLLRNKRHMRIKGWENEHSTTAVVRQ